MNEFCPNLFILLDLSHIKLLTVHLMSDSSSFKCTSRGSSLPSWLMWFGLVLLRQFIRTIKSDPLVDKVALIGSNPIFDNINHTDRRRSIWDLAPCPDHSEPSPLQHISWTWNNFSIEESNSPTPALSSPTLDESSNKSESFQAENQYPRPTTANMNQTRRSDRIQKPPIRYGCDKI